MYRCCNCGEIFDEPIKEKESYENYYGVASMFSNYNYFTLEACPYCGSDDIEEVEE